MRDTYQSVTKPYILLQAGSEISAHKKQKPATRNTKKLRICFNSLIHAPPFNLRTVYIVPSYQLMSTAIATSDTIIACLTTNKKVIVLIGVMQ